MMTDRLWLIVLPLVLLAAHTLFFVGYTVSDDSLYLAQAQQYLAGDWSPPESHWGFRYTVVLPTWLLGALGSYTEHSLSLVPLAYLLGLLVLTIWFAKVHLGQRAAVFSGLLVATLPLFVVQSTILGADITEAFFLFACFVVFYRAEMAGCGGPVISAPGCCLAWRC